MKFAMKKAMLLAMICICLLMLVVSSYAWFATRVDFVEVQAVQLTTESVVSFAFNSFDANENNTLYTGETGKAPLGSLDAPYTARFDILLDVDASVATQPLVFDFLSASIVNRAGNDVDTSIYNFTWRITYTDPTNAVKTAGPTTMGDVHLKAGDDMQMYLDMIYLSEQDYLLWRNISYTELGTQINGLTENDFADMNGFAHSADSFRGAAFSFNFQMSVAQAQYAITTQSEEYVKLSTDALTDYAGQTGKAAQGNANAPYMAQFTLSNLSIESGVSNYPLDLYILAANVYPLSGKATANGTDFTWRLSYVDGGGVTRTKGPHDGAINLAGASPTLTIIYLSEEDYVLWLDGNYAAMSGFALSGATYAGTDFVFMVGMNCSDS